LIILIILSFIIGAVVAGVSGFNALGLIAGVFFFLCGLPGAVIGGFIHGEVSYAQDRADYRQLKSDISAREIAEAREYSEDERNDKLVETIGKTPTKVYHDNREQHIHLHRRV